jgi:hypothetical protein
MANEAEAPMDENPTTVFGVRNDHYHVFGESKKNRLRSSYFYDYRLIKTISFERK